MKRFFRVAVAVVLSLTYLLSFNIPVTATDYELTQEVFDSWVDVGITGGVTYVGENITLEDYYVTALSFYLKKGSTASLTYKYVIYSENSTKLAETAEYNDADLSLTGQWYEHDLVTPVTIDDIVMIGVFHSEQNDTNNRIKIAYENSNVSSTYPMSTAVFASMTEAQRASGDWTDDSTKDCAYRIRYQISDTIPTVATYASVTQGSSNIVFGGVISNIGGANITQVGAEWGTSTGNYTSNTTASANITSPTTFSVSASYANFEIGETYYFRVMGYNSYGWGYGEEQSFVVQRQGIIVDLIEANLLQGNTGNWTCSFLVKTYTSTDNVSAHLGTAIGVWENDSNLTVYSYPNYNYLASTQGETGSSFPLTANTTYYYQGYAIEDGVYYYSEIMSFTTPVLGEEYTPTTNKPVVSIVGIDNISEVYDTEYRPAFEITVEIISDEPILYKAVQFSLYSEGDYLLTPVGTIVSFYELSLTNQYSVLVTFGNDALNIDWETGDIIYCQASAKNKYGTAYSTVETITVDMQSTTVTTPTTSVKPVSDWLEDTASGWGLVGTMGNWAMMFIIELAVALIFGIALYTSSEKITKIAISVTWLLASAAVVGGFLFSGKLGVFAIVVAVGAVVAIIMIFIGNKLSGSTSEV